ncbi:MULTISPECIES: TonB-dependent receptor plug domain-containing protein [Pseudoalteromonas]|uniref:TonB-dependent receptor plug domain-containing protein n=1 Tax=Pseudoalteromonas TaxID=53246 RepID=UPI000FFE703E|nr:MULTISPECIES: TonB-dependent receptor [Pseudoalteromonas]MCG9760815.1 TonB-dependent receptor [Pseudoalteromonas sp. Isolate6]NKC21626.1 TonB-dependent receptor [Pseudoalteromonas galatheae]RXE88312.1 ferric-rhodotorulic acid transporter [Pseudoalteromonas sp. A757]
MKNLSALIKATLFLIPFAVVAESDAADSDLYQLSFEELLNVNVSIATKTDETRASVPSSITVFNSEQINSLGVDNVYDLMNFVPGFQSTRGDWVGAVPKEHTRGVYLDTGHVLVMIDGQRLNESSFGKASVYTPYIPIEIINKVEFIRGPGSALYGSNAFLGVMNIITKKRSNQLSVGYGEHGNAQAALNLSRQVSDETRLYANVAFNKRSGDSYFGGAVKDPLESLFVVFGGSHQALKWQVRFNRTQLDEFLNLSRYSPENEHKSENYAATIEYVWRVTEQLELTHKLSFIEHNIESAGLIVTAEEVGITQGGDFLVGPAWQSRDLTYNLDGGYKQNDRLQWNFGVELSKEEQSKAGVRTSYYDQSAGDIIIYNHTYLGGIQTISDYAPFYSLRQDFDSYAGYVQAKYRFSEKLSMFTGVRYDEVKNIDDKLSPRLAFVYDFDEVNTLKLQYGESFRTPVSNELNSNDDVTSGNSNLTSEYVKTTELVWHYQDESKQFDVVLFDNELEDFINLVPVNNEQAEFTFDNIFETSMQGLEINSNFNLTDSTWIQGAYTQLFDEPLNGSFKKFAALAFTHKVNDFEITFNAIWRDKTQVPVFEGADIEPFSQDSYYLLGATFAWQWQEDAVFQIKAENLTDKKYDVFDPRMTDGRVPQEGRNLRLQIKKSF